MTAVTEDTRIRDHAINWLAAGQSVIPVTANGRKVPAVRWARYQTERADVDQVREWFPAGTPLGIGIVTGTLTRTEMLECEAEAVDRDFPARIRDLLAGRRRHPEVWDLLSGTYIEESPSGGIHWYYRITGDDPVAPNTPLARRRSTPAELTDEPKKTIRVLVETRGEGGYSVVAPSGGTVHSTGRPWAELTGDPHRLAELTGDQVTELHAVCRLLDEMPAPPPPVVLTPAAVDGTRTVGSDFNAAHSCTEVLTRAGWTCIGANGSDPGTRWRKPGARDGHHATLGHAGADRVKVFSTAADIPQSAPGASYDAFGLTVWIDYAGDFTRATRDLAATGRYGVPPKAAGITPHTRPDPGWPPPPRAEPTDRQEETPPVTTATVIPLRTGTDAAPPRRLRLTRASMIKPARVRWLWDLRMALGALSLIAGPEGLGKSTLAYLIAAMITRGTLPGEFCGRPKTVLVCATEDAWAETIVPRLMAAGADLDRIIRMEVINRDDVAIGLELPADLDDIKHTAKEEDAVLLLLDPLLSRLSENLDTHKDAEVRRALEPLVKTLEEARIAALGLIHLNKGGASSVLDRVMASKAFTAVARSVSVVITDPDDDDHRRRLFGTPKNNLGPSDMSTLTFTIEEAVIPTADGPTKTGFVKWGENSTASIQEAMDTTAAGPGMSSVLTEAVDWLSDVMEKEARIRSADVKARATKAGIKESTLVRARKKLGLRHVSEGFPRETWWYQDGFHPVATKPEMSDSPVVSTDSALFDDQTR